MRRRWVSTLLALAAALAACHKKKPQTLNETTFKLPNGLQVDVVTGPCGDKGAIAVLFPIGRDQDPPDRSGLSLVIARLLSAGGPGDRAVDSGADYTAYTVAGPAGDRLLDELDAIAARVAQLGATDADVAQARTATQDNLVKLRGGDPTQTAMAFAAEAVQPSRGNGWRGGVAGEIDGIDLAQVDNFWQAHFKPGNARLVVVGHLDPAKVRARVEKAFGALPAGTPAVQRPPAGSTVTGTLVMGDAPSAVAIAIPGPAPSEPTYPAFLVLAARLMAKPAGGWQASYDPIARPETLFVTGPVAQGEQPEPAAGRIRDEVAALVAKPLAQGEIAAARARFGLFLGADALASCKSDARGLALARARREQLGVTALPLAKVLDGTTQQDLEAAAKLFDAKRAAAVIAGGAIH